MSAGDVAKNNEQATETVHHCTEAVETTTTLPIGSVDESQNRSHSIITTRANTPSAAHWHASTSNPLNWSRSRKWLTTILFSTFTFNTLMTSTMVIPALPQITNDLRISSDARTQTVLSIFPLAYACGFFLWAPLSELYGRLSILHIAGLWFLIWNMLAGFAKRDAVIVAGRLLSGTGAASALAVGPAVMGEIWRPEQRGRSLAILSVVSLLGPSVGPILGGVIASQGGETWRWAFWSTSILQAVLQLLAALVLKESHMPTIIKRQNTTRNVSIGISRWSYDWRLVFRTLCTALKRPFQLSLTQPILICLTLYTGIAFGILYLVLSTINDAFQQIYGQSLSISSLNFLSFGIGMTIGAQLGAPLMDRMYKKRSQRCLRMSTDTEKISGANIKPPSEIRLVPFIPAVLITATGALVYGWTLQFRTHWIGPNIGLALFGAGNQAMTQCTNAYVLDSFSTVKHRHSTIDINQHSHSAAGVTINISASAMCIIWAAKSIGGFAYPLAAPAMLRILGWGWTGTVVAVCTIVIGVPVATLLSCKGRKWRESGRDKI